MKRRSFLTRLAKAVVIAATAPIIVREALRIETKVIGNFDMDAYFRATVELSRMADHGPHFYDWVMAIDKDAYLEQCRQRRLNHQP